MSVLHTKKLFGGLETAMEVHQRVAWANARCPCGKRPIIRILSFASVYEANRRWSPLQFETLRARHPDGNLPLVRTAWGVMIKVGEVYGCSEHQREAERAAAKHPDWVHVHIDRGPEPDRPSVQVPGTRVS
jgi:hypothetical protein